MYFNAVWLTRRDYGLVYISYSFMWQLKLSNKPAKVPGSDSSDI